MDKALQCVVDNCQRALDAPDPQAAVAAVLLDAAKDAAVVDVVSKRTKFTNLADLALHRSERLTLLAGALPPAFSASPHNHNLWSVVAVLAGREDNRYFERSGDKLEQTGENSVVAPGVLPNPADVIHAIQNPLDTPLVVLHAYGGDLFATARSSWDPDTHEEIPYDWSNVRSKP
jgi:predicted metal-dependent enzyme (double-stranded beta helix superfamily)